MSQKRKAPTGDVDKLREGEWMCSECSARNYSARIVCYKCPMTKRESEVRTKGKSALDWECYKCKANNFSFRNTCFKCLIPKHDSDALRADREGVPWLCRFCNLENFAHRRDCFKCKRSKELADIIPPRRMMSPPPGMYPRRRSPMRGYSPPPMGRFPGRSRSPPSSRRLLPSPPRRPVSPLNKVVNSPSLGEPDDWQCQLCFTRNGPRRNDCYKCTTPRGSLDRGPGPSIGPVHSRIGVKENPGLVDGGREGDWKCLSCDVLNFAFRKECFKCKAPKVDESESLKITINNNPQDNQQILLNHSMKSSASEDTSLPKRRRPNEFEGSGDCGIPADIRKQWGSDWTCGYCGIDMFPKRGDCYKCGRLREDCEMRGSGPSDHRHLPNDMRNLGPRFDPRDRYGPPRDTPGSSGPPPGYSCRCGNFNRVVEPECLKCGRPNDCRPDGWRDGPRSGPFRGGLDRSPPPRFYSDSPRGRGRQSPPRKVNKTTQQNKNKGKDKYFSDWKCGECDFVNFAKRGVCKQCSKKKADVEQKDAVLDKVPVPPPRPPVKADEKEWDGKSIQDVIEEYCVLWQECEANPEKKFTQESIDGRQLFKVKRIAKRIVIKAKKKHSAESEEAKTAQKNYDMLCSLHQKVYRDLKGSDGDWACPSCEAHNFANREKCFKCATEKPPSLEADADAEETTEEANAEEGDTKPDDQELETDVTRDDQPTETSGETLEKSGEATEKSSDEIPEDITIPEAAVNAVDFQSDY